jgi:hypothetical protein
VKFLYVSLTGAAALSFFVSTSPTVLCKIVGVYQIGIHNRLTGKRTMEQVAVMANIFHDRKITRVFDLKGSLRGRFAAQVQGTTAPKDDANAATSVQSPPDTPSSNTVESIGGQTSGKNQSEWTTEALNGEADEPNDDRGSDYTPREPGLRTLLDGDFLSFTEGRPMPLTDRAKSIFQMSILNVSASLLSTLDTPSLDSHMEWNHGRTHSSYLLSTFWTIQFLWVWTKKTWNLWSASSTLCVNTTS